MSGNAEQHSQTEILRVCQLARRPLTTASLATMFCRDSLAKSTSSVLINVCARSSGDVELRQYSKKRISVSKGVFQSIREVWTYCRLNRIANTLKTLSIVERLGGWSINKR